MITKQKLPDTIKDAVRRLEPLEYVLTVLYKQTEIKTEFLPSGKEKVRERFDLIITMGDEGYAQHDTSEVKEALMPHLTVGNYEHLRIIPKGWLLEKPDFSGMTLAYSRK